MIIRRITLKWASKKNYSIFIKYPYIYCIEVKLEDDYIYVRPFVNTVMGYVFLGDVSRIAKIDIEEMPSIMEGEAC